jgi:hypothetical protein
MATFRSVFSSVFGGEGTLTPEDTMGGAFDGITWPLIHVYAAFGASFTPAADALRLGVGPGLGTGKLGGGIGWVDITNDVQVIRRDVGRDSPVDQARIGTCTLVVDNRSGDYDPDNLAGPYVAAEALVSGTFESAIGTWANESNAAAPVRSTAQAQTGTASMLMESLAAGSMTVRHAPAPAATNGVAVTPSTIYWVVASLRAATAGRLCQVGVNWYDSAGTFLATDFGATATDTTTGWTTPPVLKVTSPANAALAIAIVRVQSTAAAAEQHYVDDVTFGPAISLVEVGTPVQVLAEFPIGTVYPRFYGELADIAPNDGYDPTVTFILTDGLEKLGRARLAATPFTPQFDGDTSGERIGHLADAAGWPSSLRALDTGYATLGPTTMGASALELMRKVEATEVGLLFADGAGTVVFYDRHRTTTASRSTTVQASLTDTGGPGEVEMTGLQRARSRERVVNDWHITRESGYIEPDSSGDPTDTDNPVEQVATDQASVDAFGLLSGGQGLGPLLRTDEEALAMAQGLLPTYPTPQTRIREVAVDAITQGRWAQLLPLGLLDRISVARDYGPVTVAAELLIQAMAEEIRNDETNAGWTFTFSTANPTPAPSLFVLGSSQLGVDGLGW